MASDKQSQDRAPWLGSQVSMERGPYPDDNGIWGLNWLRHVPRTESGPTGSYWRQRRMKSGSVSCSVVSDSLCPMDYIACQVLPSMEEPGTNTGKLPLPSPGELLDPGIEPRVSCIVGSFFTIWATREALREHQKQHILEETGPRSSSSDEGHLQAHSAQKLCCGTAKLPFYSGSDSLSPDAIWDK